MRLRLAVPRLAYDRTRFALLTEGEAILGGDPLAQNAPRRKLNMPAYLIARRPVSCRAYLEFLNSILARGAPALLSSMRRVKHQADPLVDSGK